jgi:transcriptional regulator with XRE-family HTH domain
MAKQKKEIQHDEIVRRFAERLRGLRVERGMTQAQLAERAEVSVAYVGRLERCEAAPGIDLVARLAAALGAKAAELLPAEDPPDAKEVLRDQARLLFDAAVQTDDEALLGLLVQFLSRLGQTAASPEQDE